MVEQGHEYLPIPGPYMLLNSRSGTALDLSGADRQTVIGYPPHGGENQQWDFIPSGNGYAIRSVWPSDKYDCGLYLTVQALQDHAPVIATPFPVSWDVRPVDEGTYQIYWPNTDFVLDLADWGNAAPGTKLQLMKIKPRESCQIWRLVCQEEKLKYSQSQSKPSVTETVMETKDDYRITTIRTTTTTATTVTTVMGPMARTAY